MKFQIAINLERMNDQTSMTAVRDHTLRMVKMADDAGFDIVWAAEHHALEMTIAPNPFQILTFMLIIARYLNFVKMIGGRI